jgi:hypothetical protein
MPLCRLLFWSRPRELGFFWAVPSASFGLLNFPDDLVTKNNAEIVDAGNRPSVSSEMAAPDIHRLAEHTDE